MDSSTLESRFSSGQWPCGDTAFGGEMMRSNFHLIIAYLKVFLCALVPQNLLYLCQSGWLHDAVKMKHLEVSVSPLTNPLTDQLPLKHLQILEKRKVLTV